MAWTTTSENVTAAKMNETAPGIATATGRVIVTDGTNSIVERVPAMDQDAAVATFTNTSYLTLANVTGGSSLGGEVEVTVTTGTSAIVFIRGRISATTTNTVIMSYSVSSATTVAAADVYALAYESATAGEFLRAGTWNLHTGLTAGSNVFTLSARVTAGTGTVDDSAIFVFPL